MGCRSVQTCARAFLFSIGWTWKHVRLARGARRRCCGRHSHPPSPGRSFPPAYPPIALQSFTRNAPFSQVAMARRSVRRSVQTSSRTDQVCGAKQRWGRAVSPLAEAVITGPAAYPSASTRTDQADHPTAGVPRSASKRIDQTARYVSIISSRASNSCPQDTQRIQSDSTVNSSDRIPMPPQSGQRASCTR